MSKVKSKKKPLPKIQPIPRAPNALNSALKTGYDESLGKSMASSAQKRPWSNSQFSLSKALKDWDEICQMDLPDQHKEKMQRFRSLLRELESKLKQTLVLSSRSVS
jgi:hypothetical protein